MEYKKFIHKYLAKKARKEEKLLIREYNEEYMNRVYDAISRSVMTLEEANQIIADSLLIGYFI